MNLLQSCRFLEILKTNKSNACLPVRLMSFQSLDDTNNLSLRFCDTPTEEEESMKIWRQSFYSKTFNSCNPSCKQVQYNGDMTFAKGRISSPKEIQIQYIFPSHQVQKSEEYKMFGVNELIGTIGGHSGLFIGFSFYGFISTILGYFQRHV